MYRERRSQSFSEGINIVFGPKYRPLPKLEFLVFVANFLKGYSHEIDYFFGIAF
jgi:hypothetical protein